MEDKFELLNNQVTQTNLNNSKNNSNIIFITNARKNNFVFKNDSEYKCEDCGKKFFSKYNKKRHIDEVHLKILRNYNFNNNMKYMKNKNSFEKSKEIENDAVEEKPTNFFIGFKRKSNTYLNKLISENNEEKISLDNKEKGDDNILTEVENIATKKENNILIEEKNEEFLIIPKEVKNKKNISDIIIQNLYCILNNNEYYALLNFFMFKELIIGHGRYGTVFFGIDIKNARPIAIKVSNEKKCSIFLSTEIEIMQNLSKYKIFTQVYDEMKLLDQIYIFETLQGPDLSKIKKFYGEKFSILTVYKIGIEILRCLKYIHQIGYLYIDLKENNIALLCNPITYRNKTNNLILIDYGFCEKFNTNENKSPKGHGHPSYASINSLKGNAISRKDDIIALCYLMIDLYCGELPWDGISSENDKYKRVIKLKEKYNLKKSNSNGAKEISFIYDAVNCLKFNELPNYDNYIYLLENYIKNKTGKSEDELLFDWEKKIIERIKYFGGAELYLKNDKEILGLFKGYPDFFTENFLERYTDEKYN